MGYLTPAIKSIEEIRNKVNSFIDFSMGSKENYVNVYKIVKEFLPKRYIGLEIIIVPDDYMKAPAQIDVDNLKLWISESTDRNARYGYPYDRFTLAHEIGHLELKHSSKTYARNGELQSSIERALEQNANLYAVELLIPYQKALKFNTIEDISEEFGVSRETARIYLINRDGIANHRVKTPTNSGSNNSNGGNGNSFAEIKKSKQANPKTDKTVMQTTIFD